MITMKLGGYLLAFLRKANPDRWEPAGLFAMRFGNHDYNKLSAVTLDGAKAELLNDLPEICRSLVTWEGEL